MERDGQKVLEFFIALVFIAILIFIVVLATSGTADAKTISSSSYSSANSYVIYSSHNPNYSTYQNSPVYSSCCGNGCLVNVKSNQIICQDVPTYYVLAQGPSKEYYSSSNENSQLRYSISKSEDYWSNIAGKQIKQYTVRIKDTDYQGGYFGVRFHLYDYYGNEWSDYIIYYVQPGQEKEFQYTHVREDFLIYSWKYDVDPGKKSVPSVNYEAKGVDTRMVSQWERVCDSGCVN